MISFGTMRGRTEGLGLASRRPGLASLACMALFCGCGGGLGSIANFTGPKESDEELIARILVDVHNAMEAERIYTVLAHVSRSYRDTEDRDYAAIEAYLGDLFERYRNIRIFRARPRIFVQGNEARALETFGTRAAPASGSSDVPIDVQGQVTVYLVKVDNTWKIIEWGNMS